VLITGLLLYLIVYETPVYTGDPLFIPALILVGASTAPAAFAVYGSHLTGATQVSARTLALRALGGGVLGAVIAGVLETSTARATFGLVVALHTTWDSTTGWPWYLAGSRSPHESAALHPHDTP